jgi:regulator of protease activity HflC (stomatin/prohibitin superfamily)
MKIILAVIFAIALSGCERIQTGEVGLRIGFDKQVSTTELQPGSFNQTIVGSVLTFPVRDISLPLDDMHPQTADGSTLEDMDITVIYSINPAQVGELYNTKSHGMHAYHEGDVYLMYNYLTTIARSAAYKASAKHEALKIVVARSDIEGETQVSMIEALKAEKLDAAITISKVQVRNVQPAKSIIDSANAAISRQNELKAAVIAVQIAQQEAERQTLLSRPANLEYMKAQAALNISEGVREGKVHTIIVPSGFTMLGSMK